MKAAGGIRTAKDAIRHLVAVNEIAGPDWLHPALFRFGASSLLGDLLRQRRTQLEGHYVGRRLHRERLMDTWTYAPAPESAALANLQPTYRPFVDGAFVDGGGEPLKTVNPATEEVLAEVGTADESDVDRAVAAARRAFEKTWGPMPGAERAKYLFRIARMVAERARELAVLETLDNGKPIRESRDVDVPTASAHLFHHAGWADKLEYAGLGPRPAPARRGRRGDPVELPAADGGLEDRPRAGLRQHHRAQAGRDHPADRAGAGRDRRRGRAAGGGAQRAARRR